MARSKKINPATEASGRTPSWNLHDIRHLENIVYMGPCRAGSVGEDVERCSEIWYKLFDLADLHPNSTAYRRAKLDPKYFQWLCVAASKVCAENAKLAEPFVEVR